MRIIIQLAVLALAGAGTWWLTGRDKTPGGETKRGHHLTRALRTLAVVFLTAVFIGFMGSNLGMAGIPFLIVIPMGIAIVLRSSVSELLAHGFLGMIDPSLHDHRELDPQKARRCQDAIAHLIHHGRREEAIKLCEELKQSGEVDLVTLQDTLEFLGVKQDRAPAPRPLNEAARLRAGRKFAGAERLLKSLLVKNPADEGAAIMLMRLYAQDLHQPDRAEQVLHALELQPHVSADHLEFARRSIVEWSQPQPPPLPQSACRPKAETLEELLAHGGMGAAVEMLEAQIQAQPGDVELQLKLAEVYAVNCRDLRQAEKIIQRVERVPNVRPEQIAWAQAKLHEWHQLAGRRHGAA